MTRIKKIEFISQHDFNYLNEIKMLWKLRNGIVNLGCFIKDISSNSSVKCQTYYNCWKFTLKDTWGSVRTQTEPSGEPLENLWRTPGEPGPPFEDASDICSIITSLTFLIASKSLNSNDPLAVLIPCNNKKTQRMVPVLGIHSWRFLGSSLTFNFYLCDSLYQMFI